MKKLNKILCVLLALAMVFALVACGGTGDTTETEAQGETGSVSLPVRYPRVKRNTRQLRR